LNANRATPPDRRASVMLPTASLNANRATPPDRRASVMLPTASLNANRAIPPDRRASAEMLRTASLNATLAQSPNEESKQRGDKRYVYQARYQFAILHEPRGRLPQPIGCVVPASNTLHGSLHQTNHRVYSHEMMQVDELGLSASWWDAAAPHQYFLGHYFCNYSRILRKFYDFMHFINRSTPNTRISVIYIQFPWYLSPK